MDAPILIIMAIAVGMVFLIREAMKQLRMTPAELKEYKAKLEYGDISPVIICPHCQTKGKVRTKRVDRKRGVSGGKATAAVLTGGFSLLATGLSRKEKATRAHCDNCDSTWDM